MLYCQRRTWCLREQLTIYNGFTKCSESTCIPTATHTQKTCPYTSSKCFEPPTSPAQTPTTFSFLTIIIPRKKSRELPTGVDFAPLQNPILIIEP
ncbi:hypothetical protein AC578_9635 [Pseudocercospora eumusae]|uniref:Uncharacterized protein n=1 Tax=Pseudocercospora eumusae TaxID=321146 RepID=A0A139H172_9PEZI|nr:hypothetical protein AC578_9635 [Pseudocercospora eumusae]